MKSLGWQLRWLSGLIGALLAVSGLIAQTTVPVPLVVGDSGKINLGFFSGGSLLQISASGTGDLVDSRYQTNPNGSMAAAPGAPYLFTAAGATYGSVGGFPSGDGINRFVGGGANYDFSGSGWMFAGKQTSDTTDPAAIRAGAIVGTFIASPSRGDWFLIGYGGTFSVPTGGANLFVAVNDSYSPDNHGSYSLSFTVVPEPSVATMVGAGLIGLGCFRRRWR